MGTFAELLKEKGSTIPESKREEFESRLEQLFQAGGMMEEETVSMYGFNLTMIRKVKMHEDGMDFNYNYFEDDSWENAGYNRKEKRVYSNKIGWSKFHKVITAAYVLQSLYESGAAAAKVDNGFIASDDKVAWINGLFDECFADNNPYPWRLYEASHDEAEENSYLREVPWMKLAGFNIDNTEGLAGLISAAVVQEGTQYLNKIGPKKENSTGKDTISIPDAARALVRDVREYHKESRLSTEEQINTLLDLVKLYYVTDLKCEEYLTKCESKGVPALGLVIPYFGLAPVAVKAVAETYDKDFWKLWNRIRDVVENSNQPILDDAMKQKDETPDPIEPISTAEYLRISEDDRIPYWSNTDSILFSKELEGWFDLLRKQYDQIMGCDEEIGGENKIQWILGLANYASEEYYRIYVFSDFFEETLGNLSDRRYLAVWKMFENMLYDPKMEQAGSVIFGPEDKNEDSYWRAMRGTRRPLKSGWAITPYDEKFNEARVTLRRFLALVANKELRKKVFEF